MAKADSNNTTPDASRRRFIAVAAAASAVSAYALAAAAMPIDAARTCSLDDSRLVELEEMIFEYDDAAGAFDSENIRNSNIWQAEYKRLADEVDAGRSTLTKDEIWAIVVETPASKEHDRISKIQNELYAKSEPLIAELFATPALTSEGRRAKAMVLIGVIMDRDWQRADAETDYPEQMARNLLIEFVGGEPGEMLRGQFI